MPDSNEPSTTPPSPPQATTEKQSKLLANATFWTSIGFIVVIVLGLIFDAPILRRLSDPAFARGLITFIISVATIGLAFVLVSQSFSVGPASEGGFRRAREIFAGLMGVLGTIVGFYFGSVEKPSVPLEIAPIQASDRQLLTHVSGGSPPYGYSIRSTDNEFKEIEKLSEDGWIIELLGQLPKSGSTITVEVTDNKEQKVSRKIDFPSELKTEGIPTTVKPTG